MTAVVTIDLPEERRTRVFARHVDHIAEFVQLAEALFTDEEDRAREPALREMLKGEIVYVDAHAGVDPADVLHVFVRRSQDEKAQRVFACVIATEARMERLLKSEPFVAETFSFQVSSGRFVTAASTIAAFEAWFERTFPDMRLPVVSFDHITESVDAVAEGDLSDIPEESDDSELPTSFEDVGSLVAA